MPKISVIMPVYNAQSYLHEAIDSILGQTCTDFEFIIIDDGSTDGSAGIIRGYDDARIRFYQNERNMGVADTLNRGLSLSEGEYIARMDSDDISLPERLKKQSEYLDRHPELAVLGTNVEIFCGDRVLQTHGWSSTDPAEMKRDLFFSCGLAHPSVMMRRKAALAAGGYCADYNGLEDYELWYRISREHGISTLPDVLLRYRMHEGQVTQNPSPQYLDRLRRLKQRQLDDLGVSLSDAERNAYFDCCAGRLESGFSHLTALGTGFDAISAANAACRIYDPALLDDSLRSILIRFSASLSRKEQRELCSNSRLLRMWDIRKAQGKQKIKAFIGRGSS